ncbi:hypothetical protein WIW49_08760 [Xanthomonas euroxanthea]
MSKQLCGAFQSVVFIPEKSSIGMTAVADRMRRMLRGSSWLRMSAAGRWHAQRPGRNIQAGRWRIDDACGRVLHLPQCPVLDAAAAGKAHAAAHRWLRRRIGTLAVWPFPGMLAHA